MRFLESYQNKCFTKNLSVYNEHYRSIQVVSLNKYIYNFRRSNQE